MLFPQIPDFEAPAQSGLSFAPLLLNGHSWEAIARLGRLCERDSGVGVLHWRAVYRRGVVCLWVFLERAFLIWLALSIWCSHFRWLALFFYPLASSASRAVYAAAVLDLLNGQNQQER